jgi:hypothetical protein
MGRDKFPFNLSVASLSFEGTERLILRLWSVLSSLLMDGHPCISKRHCINGLSPWSQHLQTENFETGTWIGWRCSNEQRLSCLAYLPYCPSPGTSTSTAIGMAIDDRPWTKPRPHTIQIWVCLAIRHFFLSFSFAVRPTHRNLGCRSATYFEFPFFFLFFFLLSQKTNSTLQRTTT